MERLVLGEVGVSPDAERIYQVLLGEPGATLAQLGRSVGFGRVRLRRAVEQLERGALVSRRSGSPTRFQPTPPDVVVDALISAREEALHQTRLDAQFLQSLRTVRPEQERVTELVEVLTSRESYAQRWSHLQATARKSLEVFVRPPFVQHRIEDSEPRQSSLLGQHVVSRAIYDESALRQPGVLDHARRMAARGEQTRVVSELPMKLSLTDRSTALVPFVRSAASGAIDGAVETGLSAPEAVDAGLVVHESALLDALTALFDLYWERGADLFGSAGQASGANDPADEDTVLTLMAAGWKDEAIAGQLGVSPQTVRRRIRGVQSRLGVATRFQVGLQLGRQGWAQDRAAASPGRTGQRGRRPDRRH